MIGKTISHFKILAELGRGGIDVVYKAEDTRLDRFVALKFLPAHLSSSEEEKQRFIHEAKAASALEHNNICNIHEIDKTEDDQIFISMAYYDGETLKEKIERGPLKLAEAIDIARQTAKGLAKAHEKDIVHRDLKPANVMITQDGIVKIVDFGLAKLGRLSKHTKAGTTLGTAAYMSPEQTQGIEVDHRTDIFSLGVLFYEMLTGQLPFKGDYEQAVTYSILHEDPEPITSLRTGVPMELERLVNKCLQKEPSDRYQRADELLVDLRQITKVSERGQGLSGISNLPKVQNLRKVPFAGAVLSILILAAVWYLFFRSGESQLASERKMLVVLPFENLGPPEDEYFADGITEEITSRLAGLHGLGVISRTSAIQYKNMEKTIAAIGEELDVGYVLEGTIRWDRSGSNRVRVTPQLIRVSDDTHLWTKTYDKVLDEIFAAQSGIAEEVAKQLDLTLLEPERKALGAKPTENMQAYDLYLRGRHLDYLVDDKKSVRLAVQMLEEAVGLDSTFALAYTALSIAHGRTYWFSYDETAKRLSKARAAAEKALELQPDLPDAHLALTYYYYWGYRDYDRALQTLKAAHRARPNFGNDFIGLIQRRQGLWQEAIASLEEEFRLNRDANLVVIDLVGTHISMRNYKEAQAWLDLAPDHLSNKYQRLRLLLAWSGDTNKSWSIIESLPEELRKDFWSIKVLIIERKYEQALQKIASISAVAYEEQTIYEQKHLSFATTYWLLNNQPLSRTYADTSRMILKRDISKRPGVARLHSALGLTNAFLGRTEEAIIEEKRALELMPVSKDALDGPEYVQHLARIYAILGVQELAIEKLEYLMSIPSPLSVTWLKIEPIWDGLRRHPRFQKLLEKYSGSGS